MALQIGAVGGLWLAFGWANALIGAVVAFLAGTVAQVTFLPKRDSRHFVLRISSSMARRVADYERDGDAVRARAMKEVLDKVVVQSGGVMEKRAKTATVQEWIISKADADMIFAFTRAEWGGTCVRLCLRKAGRCCYNHLRRAPGSRDLTNQSGSGSLFKRFSPMIRDRRLGSSSEATIRSGLCASLGKWSSRSSKPRDLILGPLIPFGTTPLLRLCPAKIWRPSN